MFALLIIVITAVGLVGYSVIMLMCVTAIHGAQRDYYTWLKNGGGQVQNISDYYSVIQSKLEGLE